MFAMAIISKISNPFVVYWVFCLFCFLSSVFFFNSKVFFFESSGIFLVE